MLLSGVALLLVGYIVPDFTTLPPHVDVVLLTVGWILAILGLIVLIADLTLGDRRHNGPWRF